MFAVTRPRAPTVALLSLVVAASLLLAVAAPEQATAWNCQGHALITTIAEIWLKRNLGPFKILPDTFLAAALGRALSYDGKPFPRPRAVARGVAPVLRTTMAGLSCVPDDMRGVPDFDRLADTHFQNVNCFPMNATQCPAGTIAPGVVVERDDYEPSIPDEELRKWNVEHVLRRARVAAKNHLLASGGADHAKRKPGGDLVHSINKLIGKLMEASANGRLEMGFDGSAFDLTYLLHLIGDAHQPMHSCSAYGQYFSQFVKGGRGVRVDEASPPSDRGGNFWCLREPRRECARSSSGADLGCCRGDNLHRFFDDAAGFLSEPVGKTTLRKLVRGDSGAECSIDCDVGDSACCLAHAAHELIDWAIGGGDDLLAAQLKEVHMNPARWVTDDRQPLLCASTRTSKIRKTNKHGATTSTTVSLDDIDVGDDKGVVMGSEGRGGDAARRDDADASAAAELEHAESSATSSSSDAWEDGPPLVPGAPLPASYVAWAKNMLKKRIVLAGFRLGNVLLRIYENRGAATQPR